MVSVARTPSSAQGSCQQPLFNSSGSGLLQKRGNWDVERLTDNHISTTPLCQFLYSFVETFPVSLEIPWLRT